MRTTNLPLTQRFVIVILLIGLLIYSLHSFSSVERRFKTEHQQLHEQPQQQQPPSIAINNVIRAVEGLVEQKIIPIANDEQYLKGEIRALREHQQEMETHVKELELKQEESQPEPEPLPQPVEIRTTNIDLKHWYETWKEQGLNVASPAQPSIVMNVATNDIVSNSIMEAGYWDIEKLRDMVVLLSSMPPNLHYTNSNTIPFVDIGANVGWFTLTIAGWGYRVESFEPMPLNNLLISKSLRDNPTSMSERVKHHPVGLDFAPRYCAIFSHDDNINDGSSLCESDAKKLTESIKANVYAPYRVRARVKTNTLDAEFSNKDIYLLKIDVEGFEENVLARGGAQSLFRDRRVYYIISEVWAATDYNRYLKFFKDMGYDLTIGGFDGKPISVNITKEDFTTEFGAIVDVYMKKKF